MYELKPCPPFKRFTCTYEDGKAWLPASGITLTGNGELTGPAVDRLALYESLLQMDPAEAALKLRRAATENKPLTMERLRQMDGEPVWVKPTKGIAKWYLVDVAEEGCADYDMGMVDFELYGSQQSYGWLAYARKPEGSAP